MIIKIPAERRQFNDIGWLKTYWLFSFSHYFDPENIRFGNLRVFNDDVVHPRSGFDTHPHSEMEIVTIVLDGTLTHKDSSGGSGEITAGEVQHMSAGTGVRHSEFNNYDDPVHLYQIWFLPDTPGLEPAYHQKKFPRDAFAGELFPVVSSGDHPDALTINADTTIYRSVLDTEETLEYSLSENRGVFCYITNGSIRVNGVTLDTHDQGRISNETHLNIVAVEPSQFIWIDVRIDDENNSN